MTTLKGSVAGIYCDVGRLSHSSQAPPCLAIPDPAGGSAHHRMRCPGRVSCCGRLLTTHCARCLLRASASASALLDGEISRHVELERHDWMGRLFADKLTLQRPSHPKALQRAQGEALSAFDKAYPNTLAEGHWGIWNLSLCAISNYHQPHSPHLSAVICDLICATSLHPTCSPQSPHHRHRVVLPAPAPPAAHTPSSIIFGVRRDRQGWRFSPGSWKRSAANGTAQPHRFPGTALMQDELFNCRGTWCARTEIMLSALLAHAILLFCFCDLCFAPRLLALCFLATNLRFLAVLAGAGRCGARATVRQQTGRSPTPCRDSSSPETLELATLSFSSHSSPESPCATSDFPLVNETPPLGKGSRSDCDGKLRPKRSSIYKRRAVTMASRERVLADCASEPKIVVDRLTTNVQNVPRT